MARDTMTSTQNETVAIPTYDFIDDAIAASIFGWDMDRLYYMQSYNSFPIPIRHGQLTAIRTDRVVIWAKNRKYGITRYTP